MFRILDNNKDGLVTFEDWNKNVSFDHNNVKFRELVAFIKQKKYNLSKILSVLGLEGIRKVTSIKLKEGLLKLWPALAEDDALLLTKFIGHGKEDI